MRIDIDTIGTFTTAATGTVLATADVSGFEYAAFGIIISAVAGAPTRAAVNAVWADSMAGTNAFGNGDVFGTPDFTTAGKYMISRVGLVGAAKTVILSEGFLLPPPLKYVQFVADLQAGTISGTIIGFRYTR